MIKSKYNKKTAGITAILLLLFTIISCGKSIPVQEMDAARQQIDAAESENAQKYSADSYNKSREALLASHKALADDNIADAKTNAVASRQFAMQARSTSAPKHMDNEATSAKASLEQADTVYAEALAPRDFAAAKELYEDGKRHANTAKSFSKETDGKQNPADLEKSLYNYSEAARKFEASNEASTKAKNLSLSQKDDMLDSLGGVRSWLEKAEVYGAAKEDPDAVASTRAKLDESETLVKQEKLKAGYLKMKEAEKETNEILASVEGKYAKNKLAEATKTVGISENKYNAVNTKANQATIEKKAILVTIGEQIGAAKEAVGSSESFYSKKNFRDSINESEEAIRLSQIIIEQSNIMAGARSRDVNIETADGEAKNYTVQTKKPAESLWRIAKSKNNYGNGFLWKRIYNANKNIIKNPDLIFPGQVLIIPSKKGKIIENKKDDTTDTIKDKVNETVEDAIEDKTDEMEQPKENTQ